jgi:hypothetical protein
MKKGFDQLRSCYLSMCKSAAIPSRFLTARQDTGAAHVELTNDVYYYVVTERGGELERRATQSEDELLYWLASDAVFDAASASRSLWLGPWLSYGRERITEYSFILHTTNLGDTTRNTTHPCAGKFSLMSGVGKRNAPCSSSSTQAMPHNNRMNSVPVGRPTRKGDALLLAGHAWR